MTEYWNVTTAGIIVEGMTDKMCKLIECWNVRTTGIIVEVNLKQKYKVIGEHIQNKEGHIHQTIYW